MGETNSAKAVKLAREILDGSTPLFLGCRKMVGLIHRLGVDREKPFIPFIGLDSEIDEFPVDPNDRKNWNPQRLAEKDAALATYLPKVQESINEACRAVISRFENTVANKIGKIGLIRNGPHAGFSIRIQYDGEDTGGYYILIWKDKQPEGYDNWVRSLNDLEQFFVESDWDIDWPDNISPD